MRSDLWRANCIYSLFDLTRINALRYVRDSSMRGGRGSDRDHGASGGWSLPVEKLPPRPWKPCGSCLNRHSALIRSWYPDFSSYLAVIRREGKSHEIGVNPATEQLTPN
jgi:hypothetical protein